MKPQISILFILAVSFPLVHLVYVDTMKTIITQTEDFLFAEKGKFLINLNYINVLRKINLNSTRNIIYSLKTLKKEYNKFCSDYMRNIVCDSYANLILLNQKCSNPLDAKQNCHLSFNADLFEIRTLDDLKKLKKLKLSEPSRIHTNLRFDQVRNSVVFKSDGAYFQYFDISNNLNIIKNYTSDYHPNSNNYYIYYLYKDEATTIEITNFETEALAICERQLTIDQELEPNTCQMQVNELNPLIDNASEMLSSILPHPKQPSNMSRELRGAFEICIFCIEQHDYESEKQIDQLNLNFDMISIQFNSIFKEVTSIKKFHSDLLGKGLRYFHVVLKYTYHF